MSSITIKQVMLDNNLELVSGENGLDRLCYEEMISRPGLELSGVFDYFDPDRVVFLGSKESDFINKQESTKANGIIKKIFEYNPPCIIFSVNVEVPQIFIDYGNKYGVCVFKSKMRTTPTSFKLYNYLQEKLAERLSIHGTLVDINRMGTLIVGKSGIGKSEVTLELINKGHQLISDDLVEIYEREPGVVVGTAPEVLKRYLEIRGIGIVDVVSLYGARAYSEEDTIDIVVELVEWDNEVQFDRLGIETQRIKYFNTEIPIVQIPVSSGRNIALLVEAAAMNEKLKRLGSFAAQEFIDKVKQNTSRGGKKNE